MEDRKVRHGEITPLVDRDVLRRGCPPVPVADAGRDAGIGPATAKVVANADVPQRACRIPAQIAEADAGRVSQQDVVADLDPAALHDLYSGAAVAEHHVPVDAPPGPGSADRKSTRLNSSH